MRELGITQIFARSPQAKGRVERAAGTFQDRLVTELSDPRFHHRREPWSASNALPPGGRRWHRPLDRSSTQRRPRQVSMAHAQLLPGPERTSYAGARVEVLERPSGSSPSCTSDPFARGAAARRGAEGLRVARNGPRADRLRARLWRSTAATPRGACRPGGGGCAQRGRREARAREQGAHPRPDSSPAGRRSSRRSYRGSRCGQPPRSPATPSAATSGPTACLETSDGDAGTDKVAALLH